MEKSPYSLFPGFEARGMNQDLYPGHRDLGETCFKEAKLFCIKGRATLTFFAGSEVASIHYDSHRQEIFYKGHNAKNMHLTREQWIFLQSFVDYLIQEGVDAPITESYTHCLKQILPTRYV